MKDKLSYKESGVDISAGEETVDRIKGMVQSTFTPQVISDLGKFGGFYAPDLSHYIKPVFVSSIDGVGTKLKIAFLTGKHDTIGEDLVNHCTNDILVGGARPLFFLDYLGTGKLEPDVVEELIKGMVRACKNIRCALIGGEMAEMPGFYQSGEYDVAGCIVGIVEKEKVVDGQQIRAGNVLIGLASNGLHTNGYSLARKVLFEKASLNVKTYMNELGQTLGEELLRVHKCYLKSILPIMNQFNILGMAHVTGGGIVGNSQRVLPDGLMLDIDWDAWKVPPVFEIIRREGYVEEEDMRRTFNLGIGYVVIVDEQDVDSVIHLLKKKEEHPIVIGRVVEKK